MINKVILNNSIIKIFFLFTRRNEVWVEDTSFVAPDVSDERVVDAGKNEEAVAEPEHVMEEDLSLQVEVGSIFKKNIAL